MGIRELIADDGFVVQFQTVGQYRAALLRELDKMNNQLEYVTELATAETIEEREAVNARWIIVNPGPTPSTDTRTPIHGSHCPPFRMHTKFERKKVLPRFDEPSDGDVIWCQDWNGPKCIVYTTGLDLPEYGWFESDQDASAFQSWIRAESSK